MFLGVETTSKYGSRRIGLFKKPLSLVVGMDEGITSDKANILEQNSPSPFSNYTTIRFSIKKPNNVDISIYNFQGIKVKTVINQHFEEGYHSINISSDGLSSGVYYCKMLTEDKTLETRNMIVIK